MRKHMPDKNMTNLSMAYGMQVASEQYEEDLNDLKE